MHIEAIAAYVISDSALSYGEGWVRLGSTSYTM